MAKIRFIRPQLGTARSQLSMPAEAKTARELDRHRDRNDPCRALYKTARWQRLRLAIFLRDLYSCQCGCGHIEANTSQLVCDHVEPHNGDPEKFWRGPFQTLWKPCHDSKKQRAEYAARRSPWLA